MNQFIKEALQDKHRQLLGKDLDLRGIYSASLRAADQAQFDKEALDRNRALAEELEQEMQRLGMKANVDFYSIAGHDEPLNFENIPTPRQVHDSMPDKV